MRIWFPIRNNYNAARGIDVAHICLVAFRYNIVLLYKVEIANSKFAISTLSNSLPMMYYDNTQFENRGQGIAAISSSIVKFPWVKVVQLCQQFTPRQYLRTFDSETLCWKSVSWGYASRSRFSSVISNAHHVLLISSRSSSSRTAR